jgi:DNA polymerase-3 subunit epsilon
MHIDREKILSLPEQEGVYYFLDHKGKTIYIGKANNIRKRVLNHFNSNSETRQKGFLVDQIHDIKFALCGNELVSLVLEASEIKRVWPRYNYALKNPPARFGIKMYEDRAGFLRIGVKKLTKFESCIKEFRSLAEGREYMKEAAKQFNLCDTLCNLQTAAGPCNGYSDNYCEGACHGEEHHHNYNKKVINFQEEINDFAPSYLVIGKGRETDEKAFVFIEQNRLKGYGFFPSYNQYIEPELLRIHLQPLPHNEQVLRMVESFWAHEDYEVIEFESNEAEPITFDAIGLFAPTLF